MSNKKETIEQIISLLSSLIEDDEPAPKKTKRQTRNKKSQPQKISKSPRKKPTKIKSTNKFETMDIRGMHKEDVDIDRKLNVKPPSPRTRQYNSIEVRCRSCGKTEKVNPVLVTEASRYKCNSCSRAGG